MQLCYQTERLNLTILRETFAASTLSFYQKNDFLFAHYEAQHPANYLTLEYQRSILAMESKLLLRSQAVRYYLFKIEEPNQIIGTISFSNLIKGPSSCCQLGYKLAAAAQKQGFAFEAARFLIPELMNTYRIYRIETDILEENEPSLRLIRRLGFTYEGIARKSHEIQGVRQDHMRFSYLYEDLPSKSQIKIM